MTPTPLRQSIELLLSRRFGTFWVASLLANIGTWAQQVAQPWLLLSLGASPMLLGVDAFASGGPALLLTFVGGTLADRADRRSVIAIFQGVQMLCPVLIVALLATGRIQPWMVIAISLVVGATDALSMPSFQTIVASIVDRNRLPAGLGLNATQFNLSRILGPAIAGALMAGAGAMGAYSVSALSYVPFILVAVWILPRSAAGTRGEPILDRQAALGALRQVAATPDLHNALLTVFVTSLLCSPLLTFCPVLVRDAFAGDVTHFSVAVSAFGLGGLLAASGLLAVDPLRDRRPFASGFAIMFAVVVIAVAIDPAAWALPLLFTLAGIAMTAANVSANACLQVVAPEALRGRSVGLYMIAMRGGLSLGALATGACVHVLGIRTALLMNGGLALLLQLSIAWRWRTNGRGVTPRP